MRILWLHQYFATPKGWGAVRTYECARRFVKAGHAVDVVCCAGYDASLKAAGCLPALNDGVRVFVSGTTYRPHMGFARRVWSFLHFMVYALCFVVRKGRTYDVVIASSGPLTMAVPALIGRWLHHLPFVFEVIDVWPDSAIAAGVLKNPLLKWLSFKLESLAYKYASIIVTCSTGMTERVKKKLEVRSEKLEVGEQRTEIGNRKSEDGGRSPKVVTISNCCDLGQFAQDGENRRRTRERLGVRDDQTVALYTGAMGLSNAIPDLVEAILATMEDDRIVWWFAGSGPEEGKLREISHRGTENAEGGGQRSVGGGRMSFAPDCDGEIVGEVSRKDAKTQRNRAAGLAEWQNGRMENPANPLISQSANPRIVFFGSLPKDEVIKLYLAADVNVVTFMHEPLFYENSPNKFFDGIAAGLPTIFNRSTWLEPWLSEYDCGMICAGEHPGQEMADAIRMLSSDPSRRRTMGRNARRLAEEVFSRDKLAEKYLEILRSFAR